MIDNEKIRGINIEIAQLLAECPELQSMQNAIDKGLSELESSEARMFFIQTLMMESANDLATVVEDVKVKLRKVNEEIINAKLIASEAEKLVKLNRD